VGGRTTAELPEKGLFNLIRCPRVPWYGQAVVDGVLGTGILERGRTEEFTGVRIPVIAIG